MSGLDSTISTLLAARSELFVTALRAATGSTTSQTATQASVANTANASGTYGPTGLFALTSPPVASAQTALSSVARTLDVITRFSGAAPNAVVGDAPLWPTPPRPASAYAAFTTGLFDTAFSSNAAAVAAARAASQSMPPLPAAQIATQLAKTVDDSGLFYESHLVQWLAGQRATPSLSQEPQGRVDPRALALPLDFTDDPSSADAWLDGTPAQQYTSLTAFFDTPSQPAQPDLPDILQPRHAIELPQTPQEAAALAASVRNAPANVLSNTQHAPASASAGRASASSDSPHEAVQASINAGIHPSTLNLVRQQLDMLANGVFRWQGEAWPGTRFDWEIEREQHRPRDTDDAAAARVWRTRVTLSLPSLGMVDAELQLTGDKLAVRMKASDVGATRFAGEGTAFAQRLEAAGIQLASFSVRSLDGGDASDANDPARRGAAKPVPSPLQHLFDAPAEEGDAA
jgi:hypothetical protein